MTDLSDIHDRAALTKEHDATDPKGMIHDLIQAQLILAETLRDTAVRLVVNAGDCETCQQAAAMSIIEAGAAQATMEILIAKSGHLSPEAQANLASQFDLDLSERGLQKSDQLIALAQATREGRFTPTAHVLQPKKDGAVQA